MEVVEERPGVEGANPGPVGDRAREFRKHFAIPLDAAEIGDAAVLFLIGTIQIAAAALGDFDDRAVIVLGDLETRS